MNNKSNKFSPEVKERAIRLVQEHRDVWAAVERLMGLLGLLGLQGTRRGKAVRTTIPDQSVSCPLDRVNRPVCR